MYYDNLILDLIDILTLDPTGMFSNSLQTVYFKHSNLFQASIKRKLKSEDSPILRKSMRIDKINKNSINQKKSQEPTTPPRRAFEAEEKLKKLAEQADLAKKMVSTPSKENSLAKSQEKTGENKKSSATQGAVTRKKFQLVLQKMKNVQKKGLLSSNKRKLLLVAKKQPLKSTKTLNKVVSTKVGFHFKKNNSQTNAKVLGAKLKISIAEGVNINNKTISKTEITKNKSVLEIRAGTSKSKSESCISKITVPKTSKCLFFL